MNVVIDLDRVANWLHDQICKGVRLKPMDYGDQAVEADYELIEPNVFALYVPTEETKAPDVVATVPAICVQIIDGDDDLVKQERRYKLRLSFATWDPGTHDQDIFAPVDGKPMRYLRGDGNRVKLSHDGWRDVWNLVDRALRIIESSRVIGGIPVDDGAAVKFGMFAEDDGLADYYPFWQAWVELTLKGDNRRGRPDVDDFL